MIKRSSEMNKTVKENMRGGDGCAMITDVLNRDEYCGKARLVAVITLEPGCSIGEHIHENEEEIFYVIEGRAVYDDDGTQTVLEQGDSCICLSGQKHSLANRENSGTLRVFAVIMTL